MTADIVSPAVEIPRDRWGRPMVVPPTGGKPVAYTRCTTFVDCLEDKFNLQKWEKRMVAIGLTLRPDLLLAASACRDDKSKLDTVCDQAKEAAQGSASATTGTALHALTEQHDRGLDVGPIPDTARADLNAYVQATAGLEHLGIEEFVVHDGLQIGGTFDRLVRYQGETFIADLKTGSVDFGMGKIAMQLAVYAHCVRYDARTHERSPLADVDRKRAIVIHLPAGAATCRLLWVDIAAGWEGVQVARAVREWRKRKDFSEELTSAAVDSIPPEPTAPTLLEQIANAADVDTLTDLWRANAHEWTAFHTEAAATRKAQLARPGGEAA